MTSATKKPKQTVLDLDRVIHEPARLSVVICLYPVDKMDFIMLAEASGLTKGNLSICLKKLQQSVYVDVFKNYLNRVPITLVSLTPEGREAYDKYRKLIVKALSKPLKSEKAAKLKAGKASHPDA